MLLIDVDNHRRLDEEPRAELLTAAGNGRTALTAHFDVVVHPLLLPGGDQRAHFHTRIQAVAQLHGVGDAGDVGHHIVEMLALHIKPGASAADLALVEENRTGRTRCGAVEVSVGHDDGR
ncbi:hypothetical protein D3C78_1256260 [compost metagenome]